MFTSLTRWRTVAMTACLLAKIQGDCDGGVNGSINACTRIHVDGSIVSGLRSACGQHVIQRQSPFDQFISQPITITTLTIAMLLSNA